MCWKFIPLNDGMEFLKSKLGAQDSRQATAQPLGDGKDGFFDQKQ